MKTRPIAACEQPRSRLYAYAKVLYSDTTDSINDDAEYGHRKIMVLTMVSSCRSYALWHNYSFNINPGMSMVLRRPSTSYIIRDLNREQHTGTPMRNARAKKNIHTASVIQQHNHNDRVFETRFHIGKGHVRHPKNKV